MLPIRVAAVSINSVLGAAEATWGSIELYAARAAEAGAALVVFPELVIGGHCAIDTWELAEPLPDGPAARRLVDLARRHGILISAGLPERHRDVVFNTQILVDGEGVIGRQRKLHPSRDETLLFKGGYELEVVQTPAARIATVICYDNELPEVPRLAALAGADIIVMPHAGRASQWSDTAESMRAARLLVRENYRLYRMRARENAVFCIVTDQAGRAGTVPHLPPDHPNQPHHPGGAVIIGPDGSILAETQADEIRDEMIVADLDPTWLARTRAHPNYTLRTRRPELFAAIARDHLRD